MSKKKQATKSEKQAVKKQPTELKDAQLDEAQGGHHSALGLYSVGLPATQLSEVDGGAGVVRKK